MLLLVLTEFEDKGWKHCKPTEITETHHVSAMMRHRVTKVTRNIVLKRNVLQLVEPCILTVLASTNASKT